MWTVRVSATCGVLDLLVPLYAVLFLLECICLASCSGGCVLAGGWACNYHCVLYSMLSYCYMLYDFCSLLCYNYSFYVFIIHFMFVFLFCMFCSLFCVFWILYCLCIVSPHIHNRSFSICILVYGPVPPGGNPIAVNKYHIIAYHIKYLNSKQAVALKSVPKGNNRNIC